MERASSHSERPQKAQLAMKKTFEPILAVIYLLAFFYIAIACTVWEFRNPKANKTTLLTEFKHVICFEKLPRYQ